MASEAEKTRFVHEAQAAAALDHPNICTVHEIDEVEGQIFIVMACIEGQSLKGKIEAGPLKIDDALDIAMQVAEGLQAAHEKGITHRDIKPANVMITNKGQAKIMDFGLAKLAEQKTRLTKTGMTVGTVAYMSPEQAQGFDADHRSDIWSFGVMLYEMITGQLPFKGVYEQAVIYSILNEEPEPIIPTGSGRTGVPMELGHIVNKCLEKQAVHRYQHADDLLADLRRLQLEPKTTTRPSSKGTLVALSRKRLLTRVLPLVLLLVAIIFGVGRLFFSREAESKERIPIVVVDFVNETKEEELNGLSGMLITALEQSRRLSVLTRSQMFDILKKSGKTEVDRIDETLGREICRHAEVYMKSSSNLFRKISIYLSN
jgi:serine/threonine protein kinase